MIGIVALACWAHHDESVLSKCINLLLERVLDMQPEKLDHENSQLCLLFRARWEWSYISFMHYAKLHRAHAPSFLLPLIPSASPEREQNFLSIFEKALFMIEHSPTHK